MGPLPFALAGVLWVAGLGGAWGSMWPQYVGEQRNEAGKTYVFNSSTAFLNWVMDAGVMNVSASFFSGPGGPVAKDRDGPLTADANIWCVTVGINDSTPDGVPVLFTKNLRVTNLSDFRGRIRDTLIDTPPLGKKQVVVVLHGGSTMLLGGRQLDQTWEEVLHMRRMSGEVLRP